MKAFHSPSRRSVLPALAAVALLATGLATPSHAQDYPTRPITLVVFGPPGGITDQLGRLVAARMGERLGQTVVVENKTGAGGNLAAEYVARSPADGYTLLLGTQGSQATNQFLYKSIRFDPEKDFVPVHALMSLPNLLVVNATRPYKSVKELVDYASKNPDKVAGASAGSGTGSHLALELFNTVAGVKITHVPYKGSAPAQQDVIGGRVPLLFDVLFSSMPFVKDGRLKVLALSSPKRAAANPEIPLIAEAVPGFSAMSIIGVIAPAGVPVELRRRIGADIARGVRSPELNERMVALGMEPVGSSADEYDALIRTEIAKWAEVVKRAGIKLD